MDFSSEDMARMQRALDTQIELDAEYLQTIHDWNMRVIALDGLTRAAELRDKIRCELQRICDGPCDAGLLPPMN